jgi:hypothetical protein
MPCYKEKRQLSESQCEELITKLKQRFENNMRRHEGLFWPDIQARLNRSGDKLFTLFEMERTGGEPDVTSRNEEKDEYVFTDCSAESPAGRRSLCYDRGGMESRKENRPTGNVIDMAADMGIEILDEEQYRKLQQIGDFDGRTSSWVLTPGDVRDAGGALFCDRRYGRVFLYHNSAGSYYAARGFRGSLRL